MTTATKPKTDALTELEGAKEQLAAAREERQRIDVESRRWHAETREAEGELGHLARIGRDQFGPDGRPRPKTGCEECGTPITFSAGPGRPPSYCGPDCSAEARRKRRRAV